MIGGERYLLPGFRPLCAFEPFARRRRGERHNRARLNQPELWQSGADYLRNMRRDEVGIVALGHAGVGVTELPGDDRHRHCPHGQDRGVSVPQDVETDGGHDAGLGAGVCGVTE